MGNWCDTYVGKNGFGDLNNWQQWKPFILLKELIILIGDIENDKENYDEKERNDMKKERKN